MFAMMCSFQTMFNEDYSHWFIKCLVSPYIWTYPLTMSNGLTFHYIFSLSMSFCSISFVSASSVFQICVWFLLLLGLVAHCEIQDVFLFISNMVLWIISFTWRGFWYGKFQLAYDNSRVKIPKCDVVIALVLHFSFFVTLCRIT